MTTRLVASTLDTRGSSLNSLNVSDASWEGASWNTYYPPTFATLPEALLRKILSFVDPETLGRVQCTCRRLCALLSMRQAFWRVSFQVFFTHIPPPMDDPIDWHAACVRLYQREPFGRTWDGNPIHKGDDLSDETPSTRVLSPPSTVRRLMGKKTEVCCVMAGVRGGGRTTALYYMLLGQVVRAVPTVGFNMEVFERGSARVTVWDAEDSSLAVHYFQTAHIIVFAVDSTDPTQWEEARRDLLKTMKHPDLKEAVLLIYANKQDLPNAHRVGEIAEALGVASINQAWYIQPSSFLQQWGAWEGLDAALALIGLGWGAVGKRHKNSNSNVYL